MTSPYPEEVIELSEYRKNNPNWRWGKRSDQRGDKSENHTSHYKNKLIRLSAKEILEDESIEDISPLPFLSMEGYLVRSFAHLIGAPPKCGKTTLLAQMLKEWDNDKVLLFTEERKQIWKARMKQKPGGWDHVSFVYAVHSTTKNVIECIKEADDTIVVIDTLRNVLSGCLKNENDNSEIAAELNQIVTACERHNKTLIAFHHHRKGGGKMGEAMSGGHAFLGSVDLFLEYTADPKAPESNRRIVSGVGRVIDVRKIVTEFTESGEIVVLGSPNDLALDELKERVFDLLTDEWQKTSQVRDRLDDPVPSDNQLRSALNALFIDLKVMRDPRENKPGATYKWRRSPLL